MKIISQLRAIKSQVEKLQNNQKEETEKHIPTSSGMFIETNPVALLDGVINEVEGLYQQLISVQTKYINRENDY